MTAEIITKEDLVQFKQELIAEMKECLKSTKNERSIDEWLRSKHVREMLHISPGTLQNLRIRGQLSYKKIGGLIFYKRKDVVFLMERSIGAGK